MPTNLARQSPAGGPLRRPVIPRHGVMLRWQRLFGLATAALFGLVWLRDVVRLSSLSPQPLLDAFDTAIFHWGDTLPVITPRPSDLSSAGDDPCGRWPPGILDTIQVVLKTGVAEEPARIQSWLASVGKCIHNILIFSDSTGHVGDQEVHDALAILPPIYRDESNPDFGAYDEQRRLLGEGGSHEWNIEAGWRLDRFKFLPMIYLARQMRPSAEWYVFLESDTYMSWDNLFRFLHRFDPERSLYMGAPLRGSDDGQWFAYGGSGVVLSQAAVDKLLSRRSNKEGSYQEPEIFERQQWVEELKTDAYGESVLGKALLAAGVQLSGFYPLFYPLNLASIAFGDASVNGLWCEPVISMHKLWNPTQYQVLWEWEMRRDNRRPLLFHELFHLVNPQNPSIRDDWDNLSTQLSLNTSAHHSALFCHQACVANTTCLQYVYHDHRCNMSQTISLGGPRAPEGDDTHPEQRQFVSGWIFDRVEEWKTRPKAGCEEVRWLRSSLERRWKA